MLARESGVPESTLAAWIDRGRVPQDQDSGKLADVVRVLSGWAGSTPAEVPWQDLWTAAREDAVAGKAGKGTAKRRGAWARARLAAAAATAIGGLITALAALFAGDLHSHLPLVGTQASAAGTQQSAGQPSPSGGHAATSSGASPEDFHARANWCCELVSVNADGGYYWPGAVGALHPAVLYSAKEGSALPALMPAGLGLIEIPVQTSGTEPILVEPPKVIIRTRSRNPSRGMIAILPLGGQGGTKTGQFGTDVDNATPVTVPAGSAGGQAPTYQYVSSASPEVITLFVADTNYDCTFDIKLTWQEQGRSHTMLLSNGGKHFRIIGSVGLPWYTGDLATGGKLTRVPAGQPFSRYASA